MSLCVCLYVCIYALYSMNVLYVCVCGCVLVLAKFVYVIDCTCVCLVPLRMRMCVLSSVCYVLCLFVWSFVLIYACSDVHILASAYVHLCE